MRRLWHKAGMRYKIKVFVGLYQCLAAIPSVYDVTVPLELEHLSGCVRMRITWSKPNLRHG